MLETNAKRRRLTGKQRAPAQFALPPPALAALADEAWSEVTVLSEDARRKHMNWVHLAIIVVVAVDSDDDHDSDDCDRR